MEPLSNRATRLLEQYRDASAPTAAQQQTMLEGLADGVRNGTVPAHADVPFPEPVAGMSLGAKLGLLGLVGAVAVPLLWLATADTPTQVATAAAPPAATEVVAASPTTAAPAPVAQVARAPVADEPPEAPQAAPARTKPATRAKPAQAEPRRAPAGGPTTIDAEMRLIKQAQRALVAGDGAAALAKVHAHEQRFADGKLAQLRDVVRIDALCAVGQRDNARAAAKKFLAEHPASPHSDRARKACTDQTSP